MFLIRLKMWATIKKSEVLCKYFGKHTPCHWIMDDGSIRRKCYACRIDLVGNFPRITVGEEPRETLSPEKKH